MSLDDHAPSRHSAVTETPVTLGGRDVVHILVHVT
jgi:hypothetical protein